MQPSICSNKYAVFYSIHFSPPGSVYLKDQKDNSNNELTSFMAILSWPNGKKTHNAGRGGGRGGGDVGRAIRWNTRVVV